MKIVIDMQGAQSLNAKRGIGRYIISLIELIIQNKAQDEIILVCNALFKDSVAEIKSVFEDKLPRQNIKTWLPVKTDKELSVNIFEAFLRGLNPDIVLTSSLFEGFEGDDAVAISNIRDMDIPVAVILYDLIPLIYQSPYLDNPKMKEWYLNKTKELKKADILLSISNSSKQEAHDYLDIIDEKVVNISAAVSEIFKPIAYTDKQKQDICTPYGINKPFVLYTGGIDYRKNIDALIQAFSMLEKEQLQSHQLVIVCSVGEAELYRLKNFLKTYNLNDNEVIFTNYVPEETLIALYNLCKAFIFPSLHEGFGLPILEAMQCHKAVICANNSSLVEVLDNQEAMFDAKDINSIVSKLNQVLTDKNFRLSLEEHSKKQALKFSWDSSAKLALKTLRDKVNSKEIIVADSKVKLAYISPLPPQKSGISYYSEELLQELSKHYDIELITDEVELDETIKQNYKTQTFEYFKQNYIEYQRVLYHFGNSSFHSHMFELLEEIRGVVVLHDFYLSGVVSYIQFAQQKANFWIDELYHSHGYKALQEYFSVEDLNDITVKYPVNLSVLENSVGIIAHSDYSKNLAQEFYSNEVSKKFTTIPHLRQKAPSFDKLEAKRSLGFTDDAFIICSFGLLGKTKLNHKLLEAFLSSSLSKNSNCYLVFVGENNPEEYGNNLTKLINTSGLKQRITITGWTDTELFNTYLKAASIAVQLRTFSRGETSGTVLDCMNYGIPTIVNANGSMGELNDEAVIKLDDDFKDEDLKIQIEKLFEDENYRQTLSQNAEEIIKTKYSPTSCAKEYYETIEKAYKDKSSTVVQDLVYKIINTRKDFSDEALKDLASSITYNFPQKQIVKQLFVDISELVQRDAKTGIQRVVHNILRQLLDNQPDGYRVEPVYATNSSNGYYYAREFMAKYLDYPQDILADEPIDFYEDDIFLGLDLQPDIVQFQADFLTFMHQRGTKIYFIVYDLLPILLPETFVKGAKQNHDKWVKVITSFDGAICISKSVAQELKEHLNISHNVSWFHLGAEFITQELTSEIKREENTFLMVGTLERRKGHMQTLQSFELLWEQDIDVKLVIVGKQGWLVEDLVQKIKTHPQLDKKLFWLQNIDDKELQKLYKSSTALIAASYGEGFGLPLIEASYYDLPIIARDISVFKEVASSYAYYYRDTKEPKDLADAIIRWLKLYGDDTYPKSNHMPYLTWAQSANQLLNNIIDTRQESDA